MALTRGTPKTLYKRTIGEVNVARNKDQESGPTLRRQHSTRTDNCDVIVVIHPRVRLVSFYGAQLAAA